MMVLVLTSKYGNIFFMLYSNDQGIASIVQRIYLIYYASYNVYIVLVSAKLVLFVPRADIAKEIFQIGTLAWYVVLECPRKHQIC